MPLSTQESTTQEDADVPSSTTTTTTAAPPSKNPPPPSYSSEKMTGTTASDASAKPTEPSASPAAATTTRLSELDSLAARFEALKKRYVGVHFPRTTRGEGLLTGSPAGKCLRGSGCYEPVGIMITCALKGHGPGERGRRRPQEVRPGIIDSRQGKSWVKTIRQAERECLKWTPPG